MADTPDRSKQGSASPRTPRSSRSRTDSCRSTTRERRSANKIYRCPPTPPPQEQYAMEKSFVLDSNAVSSISTDYSKTNPKLGPILAPYNSQRDRSARSYFRFYGVDKTLEKTGQTCPGTSIEGPTADRFHKQGPGFLYLIRRNCHGAGQSLDSVNGHGQFLTDVRPVYGYNGLYGFRRNTPWLRATPSPFGTGRSPVH